MSNFSPLFIILNAGSGDENTTSVANNLATLFNDADQPYEILLCRRPSDIAAKTIQAIDQARSRNGVVVAAGGDGTIRFIAQQVLNADIPFGVLPMGTFNYFARDNGIPQDPIVAAEVLIAGVRAGYERQVQVGSLNDQVFLVNASLGLYPQLLEDREEFKQQHGRSRLVAKLAGIVTLFRRDTKMKLKIEQIVGNKIKENVVTVSTIFVGNNSLQLNDLGMEPSAESVQNGQLAIIALTPLKSRERFALALRGMLGIIADSPNVSHFSCSQLQVEPFTQKKKFVKVAMDGEVSKMHSPLVFRVGPRPLRLVVSPSLGVGI